MEAAEAEAVAVAVRRLQVREPVLPPAGVLTLPPERVSCLSPSPVLLSGGRGLETRSCRLWTSSLGLPGSPLGRRGRHLCHWNRPALTAWEWWWKRSCQALAPLQGLAAALEGEEAEASAEPY